MCHICQAEIVGVFWVMFQKACCQAARTMLSRLTCHDIHQPLEVHEEMTHLHQRRAEAVQIPRTCSMLSGGMACVSNLGGSCYHAVSTPSGQVEGCRTTLPIPSKALQALMHVKLAIGFDSIYS